MVVFLGREDVSELSCVVVLLQIPLYGFVIWVGKMHQEQLCMVVLFGEGRCTRSSEPPCTVVLWGREDLPGTTLYREDVPGTALYGGVIGEGKFTRHTSV